MKIDKIQIDSSNTKIEYHNISYKTIVIEIKAYSSQRLKLSLLIRYRISYNVHPFHLRTRDEFLVKNFFRHRYY